MRVASPLEYRAAGTQTGIKKMDMQSQQAPEQMPEAAGSPIMYTIEIACHADGTCAVSKSSEGNEGSAGGMEQEAEGQPAQSFDQAIQIATQLHEQSASGPDADVMRGYNGGPKKSAGPSPQQMFGM